MAHRITSETSGRARDGRRVPSEALFRKLLLASTAASSAVSTATALAKSTSWPVAAPLSSPVEHVRLVGRRKCAPDSEKSGTGVYPTGRCTAAVRRPLSASALAPRELTFTQSSRLETCPSARDASRFQTSPGRGSSFSTGACSKSSSVRSLSSWSCQSPQSRRELAGRGEPVHPAWQTRNSSGTRSRISSS